MINILIKESDFEIENLYSRKYLFCMYKKIIYFFSFFLYTTLVAEIALNIHSVISFIGIS